MSVNAKILKVQVWKNSRSDTMPLHVHPGDEITIETTWQNTGSEKYSFRLGYSIGTPHKWYDTGYWASNVEDYAVDSASPGEEDDTRRRMIIPDDMTITDAYTTIRNKALTILDSKILHNVFVVTPNLTPSAEIKDIQISDTTPKVFDRIRITPIIKNTGATETRFKVGISIGNPQKWHDVGAYSDGLGDYAMISLNPGETGQAPRELKIPDDLSIADVWITVKDTNLNLITEEIRTGILEIQPLVSWWENLRQLIISAVDGLVDFNLEILNKTRVLLGLDPINEGDKIDPTPFLEFVPFANMISKLFYDVDLQGNPSVWGTSDDVLDFLMVLPFGPEIWGLKLLGKAGAKVAPKVAKEGLERLVKEEAGLIAKGATKTKIYKPISLFSTTVLKRLLVQMKKKPMMAIFAIAEFPILGVMMWFATHQIMEVLGVTTKDLSFRLKKYEDAFKTLGFELVRAQTANDLGKIAAIKRDMISQADGYAAEIESSRSILVDNDLIEAAEAYLDFMRSIISRIEITPTPPPTPEQPEEEIEIPLEPIDKKYNAWKITIKAVDSITGNELNAGIMINGEWMDKSTPYYFYFEPEADYEIILRKEGYLQGKLQYRTKPLPEA